MAVDKLVDSGKLDACCAAEAAAIIAKGGGTAPLAYDFANNKGFADAIAAISGGGGLQKIGTATTDASAGTGFGQISIPASDGIFLLTMVSVTPNNTNRLPWTVIVWVDTTTPLQSGDAFQYNHGGYAMNANAIRQIDGMLQIDGTSSYRFGTSATYDLYKLY